MNRTYACGIAVVSAWSASILIGCATAHAQGVQIVIDVHVESTTGNPLEFIAFGVRTRDKMFRGETDVSGDVQITADVDPDETYFRVMMTPHSVAPMTRALDALYAARFRSARENWAFRNGYSVALVDQQLQYSVNIVVPEAIDVSGRIVDGNGDPLRAWVAGADIVTATGSRPDGTFVLHGFPKDQPAWLFVSQGDRSFVWPVPISQSETALDFAIGDIVVPERTGDGEVSCLVTDAADPAVRKMDISWTAIATDGSEVFNLVLRDGTLRDSKAFSMALPMLPAGTYVIVPGNILVHRNVQVLFQRIANNSIDLQAVNLPTVVVSAGVVTNASVSVLEVADELRAVIAQP